LQTEVVDDDPLAAVRHILGPVGVAFAAGMGIVSLVGVVFGWRKVREWRERRRQGKGVGQDGGKVKRRHGRDWRVEIVE
jgi:hypothetical protein